MCGCLWILAHVVAACAGGACCCLIGGVPGRAARRTLALCAEEFPNFSVQTRADITAIGGFMRQHAWFILPSARASFGLLAAKARDMHVPVIAWHIDPLTQILRNDVDSVLVSCQRAPRPAGTMEAVFSADRFARCTVLAITHPDWLAHLRQGCAAAAAAVTDSSPTAFRQEVGRLIELQPQDSA
jgi:hypothetical protein